MTHTPKPRNSAAPSITREVYDVLHTHAGMPVTATEILYVLPPGTATLRQVQNTLGSLVRNRTHPHIERVGHGLYRYNDHRASRRTNNNVTAVVETKNSTEAAVIPAGALHPVADAVVMSDADGNLFVVRLTKV
jgi:hypothetical protein